MLCCVPAAQQGIVVEEVPLCLEVWWQVGCLGKVIPGGKVVKCDAFTAGRSSLQNLFFFSFIVFVFLFLSWSVQAHMLLQRVPGGMQWQVSATAACMCCQIWTCSMMGCGVGTFTRIFVGMACCGIDVCTVLGQTQGLKRYLLEVVGT
jgi:hypothetical protein